jgi:uncharacterized protein YkwD
MNDLLKLTADDIARFDAEARARPPIPPVLTIQSSDVAGIDLPVAPLNARSRGPLVLTAEDLATVPEDLPPAELEALMFDLVCRAREAHLPRWVGRRKLNWHPGLATAARQHSADMLRRRYVSHNSLEGLNVGKRLEQVGVGYLACGENIGAVYGPMSRGTQGVYEIHNAFMNQPMRPTNHRGNVLNPIWTHVGIGVAYGSNAGDQLIVTQNFISTLRD